MKWLKIILVNIVLLIILFLIIDFISFNVIYKKQTKNLFQKYYSSIFCQSNKIDLKEIHVRKVENINSSKKPILIFGCSYALGSGLGDKSTFSYRLGKLTQRPVYNRARGGRGFQYALWQLRTPVFYDIVPKPEYVIYVYIQSHIPRMNMGSFSAASRYFFYKQVNKNNTLTLERDTLKEFINRFYFSRLVQEKRYKSIKKNPSQNDLDMIKLYFLEYQNEIEKHWGKDVKLVILLFEKQTYIDKIKSIFPELEAKGIKIININELSDINFKSSEYQISDKDSHPNARAWEELTPLLIKELGL